MLSMLTGLVMLCASCTAQDTVAARSTVDLDAIMVEHVEWVLEEFPDIEFDVRDHRYILDEPYVVQVGSDMMDTFYGLLECGKREFPQYDKHLSETSFHRIKFYIFSEGWFLDRETHEGYQIAGVVLAGRHVGLDHGFTENGKVITHELVHVLYPGLWDSMNFKELHAACWRDVWYRDSDE